MASSARQPAFFLTFEQIAQPMGRLNVVGMIVSPGGSHALRLDVVRDDIVTIGERLVADSAFSILFHDFPAEQPLHFSGRADFPVTSGVIRVFDALNA